MRIAVLSDIHANLAALDAVLAAIGSVDAVWQLGDVVGYGPEPDDGRRAPGARSGRSASPATTTSAAARRGRDRLVQPRRQGRRWSGRRGRIDDRTASLAGGPAERRSRRAGMTLVHGSPRDPIWEYVTSIPVARANLGRARDPDRAPRPHPPADGLGRPRRPDRGDRARARARRSGSTAARPCSTRAASASRATATRRRAGSRSTPTPARATWRRVAYDIERVRTAMLDAGLPARLADRLRLGL